ncbi:MAG: CHAT domain-containing protein [Pirellulaceae bacterium]|nr:CHAT domain-containing protein [Pirellulaceae bacterium]
MTAFRLAAYFLLIILSAVARPPCISAQAVNELPRAEYYVARELFRVGRILEAADGFKAALNRAQRVGEKYWIDSIPPLVMLGECYYQQGDLALALEQYDGALMLALANPGWINQLQVTSEQLADLESTNKGIQWFTRSRAVRAVVVPAGVQINIEPAQPPVAPQVGGAAPTTLVTQLDVSEVLHTMGIALMRRWEVLGPLAKHSPLNGALDTLFARGPNPQVPWLVSSWKVLQGIHGLASPTPVDSPQLLHDGSQIGKQADYYLSSLALLMQGKLEAREGNYAAAIVQLQDATLVAAQFEQYAMATEAVERLSACAATGGTVALREPLQRLAAWANKKSVALQLSALLGASELATCAGEFTEADKLLRQCVPLLRNREILLPRSQARLSFVSALSAFAQNRGPLGASNLSNALSIMRGSAKTGAIVEAVFQTQLILDLFDSKSLTAQDAEALLAEVIAEPTPRDWELAPLETIAELTTVRDPAFAKLLEFAMTRKAPLEEILDGMDRLQRQRLYAALPMGGRQFAWRAAVAGQQLECLSPAARKEVESTLRQMPELGSDAQRMKQLVMQLRQMPMPLEERKLHADAKKAFVELEDLSAVYESQLALISLQRRPLDRCSPPPAELERLQSRLADGDLVLGLVLTGQQLIGVALTRELAMHWQVSDAEQVDTKLRALLAEVGTAHDPQSITVIDATSPAAAWHDSAQQLASKLFPAEVQTLLVGCQRVIMIPHDRLWYVPYELLPLATDAGTMPWIAHHAVTYVPTLGSIELAFADAPDVKETVGIVDGFFAPDGASNQALAQAVGQAIPGSHTLSLAQKLNIPSTAWLKLRTDQLWVGATVDASERGWDARVLPLGNEDQSRVGSWLSAPHTSPARVLLPGLRTAIGHGQLAQGDELFLPICALLYSGTKHACLSRWPVGGTSTATLLQRQLEELQSESPSAALRRAVLALWPEQFVSAEEPSMLPVSRNTPTLISGSHPLLWSGYMAIGDYLVD